MGFNSNNQPIEAEDMMHSVEDPIRIYEIFECEEVDNSDQLVEEEEEMNI